MIFENIDKRVIILVLLAVVIVSLYFLGRKNKELIQERNMRINAEQANVRLILEVVKSRKGFTEVMQEQIELLGKRFKEINPDVTSKTAKAVQLLSIGQTENAIEDLAVILENLLKDYYKNDPGFIKAKGSKDRDFSLGNLLEYCRKENKISEVEFRFFTGVKTIRDKEDHTLNQKLDDYLNVSGLIVAFGAIVKIASFNKQQPQLA